MSRLANPHLSVLSETQALRDRRDLLLRKAQLHWFRPHQMRQLQEELQQVTTDLLKRELEARARPKTRPEPLGDAGAVGGHLQSRKPYKD
ncbi:gas vesicle protein V [Roseibium album]|uniref:gas vesicle protein V n=1 Tax=Roseibium album TaxID=311410 RepID=UPI0024927324|nr:gas vesicle protein V [Roseibium album]